MILNYLFAYAILTLLFILFIIKLVMLKPLDGNKGMMLLESLRFHGNPHSNNRKIIKFFKNSDQVNRVFYIAIGVLIVIYLIIRGSN